MKSPLSKLVSWQLKTGQLDGWTSYHIAAGVYNTLADIIVETSMAWWMVI